MNNKPAAIGMLIVLLALIAGVLYWFEVKNRQDNTHTAPAPPAAPGAGGNSTSLPPPGPTRTGVIYTVAQHGGDDNGLIARPVTFAHPRQPARDALNALVQSSSGPLPEGTELRGVTVRDGLATVNFSREFKANFHGGDTEEAQAITAIQRTLGQFPEVERVQILVEGKPIDSLGGMADISGPLDVIRPASDDTVRQARATAP